MLPPTPGRLTMGRLLLAAQGCPATVCQSQKTSDDPTTQCATVSRWAPASLWGRRPRELRRIHGSGSPIEAATAGLRRHHGLRPRNGPWWPTGCGDPWAVEAAKASGDPMASSAWPEATSLGRATLPAMGHNNLLCCGDPASMPSAEASGPSATPPSAPAKRLRRPEMSRGARGIGTDGLRRPRGGPPVCLHPAACDHPPNAGRLMRRQPSTGSVAAACAFFRPQACWSPSDDPPDDG